MKSWLSRAGLFYLRNSRNVFILFFSNIILWSILFSFHEIYVFPQYDVIWPQPHIMIFQLIFIGVVFFSLPSIALTIILFGVRFTLKFFSIKCSSKIENYLLIFLQHTILISMFPPGLTGSSFRNEGSTSTCAEFILNIPSSSYVHDIVETRTFIAGMFVLLLIYWLSTEIAILQLNKAQLMWNKLGKFKLLLSKLGLLYLRHSSHMIILIYYILIIYIFVHTITLPSKGRSVLTEFIYTLRIQFGYYLLPPIILSFFTIITKNCFQFRFRSKIKYSTLAFFLHSLLFCFYIYPLVTSVTDNILIEMFGNCSDMPRIIEGVKNSVYAGLFIIFMYSISIFYWLTIELARAKLIREVEGIR